MPHRIARNVLVVILLAGCSDNPTEPTLPDLTGVWTYSATGLSDGAGRNCTLAPFTMTLTQTGNVLNGTTAGGTLTCLNPNVTYQLGAYAIEDGDVTMTPNGGPRTTFWLVRGEAKWFHFLAETTNIRVSSRVSILGVGSPLNGDFVMVKQ